MLAAAPKADPEAPELRRVLGGDIPSPAAPPSVCVFRTPCPHDRAACAGDVPVLRSAGEGHQFACILDEFPA